MRIPYYTKDQYQRTAKALGLMDDFRVMNFPTLNLPTVNCPSGEAFVLIIIVMSVIVTTLISRLNTVEVNKSEWP